LKSGQDPTLGCREIIKKIIIINNKTKAFRCVTGVGKRKHVYTKCCFEITRESDHLRELDVEGG
jgi:hypothetical protein